MFFTAINQMMTEGVDLTLVIRKANGQLAVSTLPKSNGLKDEAQNHIVPLTVNGKPEELDAGFLQTVARPIQKAVGLITNMAQFEVQAADAQGGRGGRSAYAHQLPAAEVPVLLRHRHLHHQGADRGQEP